jgi:hypothetical protein
MNVEQLAKLLHKEYRAGHATLADNSSSDLCNGQHDHGWEACHRKDFFRHRAARLGKLLLLATPEGVCAIEQE